jgi:hypothetical protein
MIVPAKAIYSTYMYYVIRSKNEVLCAEAGSLARLIHTFTHLF